MAANSAYVIVGASLAGAKAAQTLREEGADQPIVLIGEESERPYERPPLSKTYLLGTAERETIYVHPQAWYLEHDIDLRPGVAVTSVDPTGHEVTRGLTKVKAGLDEWYKHIAPSTELRKWYSHDPARFEEFGPYRSELNEPERAEAMAHLHKLAKGRTLTLLTATKQPEISEAAVLAKLLQG